MNIERNSWRLFFTALFAGLGALDVIWWHTRPDLHAWLALNIAAVIWNLGHFIAGERRD